MDKKDFIKMFSAGIFLVFCVVIIAWVVFTIGSERGFTEPRFEMTVLFRKIGGLSVGAPVRLSGVTVGTVSQIDFLDKEVDGRGVKVTLSLYQKYRQQFFKSKKISIITEGVLGEKMVEITTASYVHLTRLDRSIIGMDPLEVQDLAANFGEASIALKNASDTIDVIVKEMKEISNATRRLLNRIEQRVIDGNLFKVF